MNVKDFIVGLLAGLMVLLLMAGTIIGFYSLVDNVETTYSNCESYCYNVPINHKEI